MHPTFHTLTLHTGGPTLSLATAGRVWRKFTTLSWWDVSRWLLPSTFSLFLQDSAHHGLFPFTVTTTSQQRQSGMDWNDPQRTQHSALPGSPFTKLGQARTISQGATQTSITGHPRCISVDWDTIKKKLSVIFSSRYRLVYMLHYNHQHSWAVMPIHS